MPPTSFVNSTGIGSCSPLTLRITLLQTASQRNFAVDTDDASEAIEHRVTITAKSASKDANGYSPEDPFGPMNVVQAAPHRPPRLPAKINPTASIIPCTSAV